MNVVYGQNTPSASDRSHEAREAIAVGMGWALAAWFLPIPVVGSVACNTVESTMVSAILKSHGHPDADGATQEKLFWFFRKKYMLVNLVTLVPYVGATVQLLEVYGLGQFVLRCCERGALDCGEDVLDALWSEVEPAIWRANEVIEFYEATTRQVFPTAIRAPFVTAVDTLGAVTQTVNKIPGLPETQAAFGEGFRFVAGAAKAGIKGIRNLF